jgi:hypothetical protein
MSCKFCGEQSEDCICSRSKWRPPDWSDAKEDADGREYERGADAMLSARDKWLIGQIEKQMRTCDIGHDCAVGNMDCFPMNQDCKWWQQFKQSLGVK